MPNIPDPERLVKIAQSAKQNVEDREWKQYHRYLAKHEKKYGNSPSEQPMSFEKYCAWLEFLESDLQIPQ